MSDLVVRSQSASSSLTQDAYERLRADVLPCRVKPGARLKITELYQSLSVSLGAVREALARLMSEGLVVSEPQRGFCAAPISASELQDLTGVRVRIETACLERTIAMGDVAWEAHLVSALHRLSHTPERVADDPDRLSEAWAAAHADYHTALAAACDSPWLLKLRDMLYDQSERYRRLLIPLAEVARDIGAEHRELVDAALDRDAARAAAMLARHLKATTLMILENTWAGAAPDALGGGIILPLAGRPCGRPAAPWRRLSAAMRIAARAIALAAAWMIAGQALASPPEGKTRMSASLVQERREMLLAQCPVPAPRATEAEAGKLPIHVTHWGDRGPAVLVVHGGVQGGLGGGPSTFSDQRDLAARGWRLQLVDRPGFGQSPSRGSDDMEADSVWIADMLGDGAFLIGHSWGGAGALLAAGRRPQAVRGLILIEPALQSLLMGDPRVGKDPALLASAQQFGSILLSAKTPGDYALGFAHSLGAAEGTGHASNTAVAALEHDSGLAHNYGCALLQAHMAPPPALRQAAAALAAAHVKVLVVTGGWSPLFDGVGQLAAELTGGRHVIVRSANHFVQLTNAEGFNAAADAFMRQAEAAEGTKGR